MIHSAKYIKDIVIQDPDTGGDVDVTIFKHQNGGIFGIDASYLDQAAHEGDTGNPVVPDPFGDLENDVNDLVLSWPDTLTQERHEQIKDIIKNTRHIEGQPDSRVEKLRNLGYDVSKKTLRPGVGHVGKIHYYKNDARLQISSKTGYYAWCVIFNPVAPELKEYF